MSQKKIAPVSALGQGIALIPLTSPPSYSRGMARRQSAGPGSPGPRLARLTPGPGREASRPAPCGAPTRHFRLTPQSALGPHQELMCPWRVIPEAARGSGLRRRPPAGAAPGHHLANASGRRPSSLDRDTQCLGEFHCEVNFGGAPSPTSDRCRANGDAGLVLFRTILCKYQFLFVALQNKQLASTQFKRGQKV